MSEWTKQRRLRARITSLEVHISAWATIALDDARSKVERADAIDRIVALSMKVAEAKREISYLRTIGIV